MLSPGRVLAADLPGHDRPAGLPLPAPLRLASGLAHRHQERDILRWSEALSWYSECCFKINIISIKDEITDYKIK